LIKGNLLRYFRNLALASDSIIFFSAYLAVSALRGDVAKIFLQHLLFVFLDKRPTRGWFWEKAKTSSSETL
jgi:hypothetical protein